MKKHKCVVKPIYETELHDYARAVRALLRSGARPSEREIQAHWEQVHTPANAAAMIDARREEQ